MSGHHKGVIDNTFERDKTGDRSFQSFFIMQYVIEFFQGFF